MWADAHADVGQHPIVLSVLAVLLLCSLAGAVAAEVHAYAPIGVPIGVPIGAPSLGVPSLDSRPPGLNMEAIAAYDGHFKYGEWLPVWVYLQNSGPDLDAEVRVRVSGVYGSTTFALHVPLPTGSRKRVPVYVLPNNFSRQLEVQLVDGADTERPKDVVLISQEVPVRPQPNINYFVGLIAPQRGALSLIAGASTSGPTRPKVLLDLSLAELPERAEGLHSFDCLILNDVDTSSLTPAQRLALETWVRGGGRLVIGGGAGAQRTASGLPESLLTLRQRRELEVDALPGLADFVGGEAVRVPGPFLLSVGDLGGGRTLAAQDGIQTSLSLIHERSVGGGDVDFVALDLTTSPFDAWAGTIAFWERLILADAAYPQGLPPDVSARQMRSEQMIYALSNLRSDGALALPSVRGLTALLGVYILLVGPVNYLVLRWRKRLHWAWVSIPLITVLFSGGAFGLGYALHGTDLILNKIAIVAAQADGTARVDTYVGLFSPARQSYEIEVLGQSLLSSVTPQYDPFGPGGSNPANDMVFVQGNPGHVRGLSINQWSMQTFMAENVWPDFGQVVGDLWFEDSTLVGTVRNRTSQTFKDAVVVMGAQFVRLGDLEPGAQAEVRLELSQQDIQFFGPPISYRLFEKELQEMGPGGPPREVQLKQQILDNVLGYSGTFGPLSSFQPTGGAGVQGLMLLAWFDSAPPEVRVAGREPAQQTTALLYAPLSPRLGNGHRLGEAGRVSVPAGFVGSQIIQMPVEGGSCGPAGVPAVYIGRGEAVFEFQLPEDVAQTSLGRAAPVGAVQIDQLTLSIRSEGGWQQPPDVALYDWMSRAWAGLDEPVFGDNVIPDAQDLVSEDGLVRVRLSVGDRSGGGGCTYLGLGFEGTRRTYSIR